VDEVVPFTTVEPPPGPAAKRPAVAGIATFAGEAVVTGVVIVAAAEVVDAFVAAAVKAAVVALVEADVSAAEVTAAVEPPPPRTMPPPSPLVITELPGELIDELTVACGGIGIVSYAIAPPANVEPGFTGPSARPWCPRRKATASADDENIGVTRSGATIFACVGGVTDVPPDEPGVDDGVVVP